MHRFILSSLSLLVLVSFAVAQPSTPPVDEVPAGALARLGTLRFRSGRPLMRVVFTADGKQIITAGQSNELIWWDAAEGRILDTAKLPTSLYGCLVLSPDGKSLLVVGPGRIFVIDPATRKLKHQMNAPPNLIHHQMTADWTGDGKAIVIADQAGKMMLCDPANGDVLKRWNVDLKGIYAIAVSPDGKQVAAANQQGQLKAWTLDDGKEAVQFEPATTDAPPGQVTLQNSPPSATMPTRLGAGTLVFRGVPHLSYSSDGRYLIAGGLDRTTPVWDAKSGKVVRQFPTQSPLVQAFMPGGRFLVAVNNGGQIQFFGLASAKVLRAIDTLREPTQDIAFSPDGELMASVGYGSALRVLELNSHRDRSAVGGHKAAMTALAFLSDGRLVTAGLDNCLICWDAAPGKELERVHHGVSAPQGMAPAPDGTSLLISGSWPQPLQWSPGKKEVQRSTLLLLNAGRTPVLSTDGRTVVSQDGQSVRVFEMPSGKERPRIGSLRGYQHAGQVVPSPHGRFLAVLETTPTPRLRRWDLATGHERSPIALRGERSSYSSNRIVVSPDARLLATVTTNRKLRVWEFATGALRLERDLADNGIFTAGTFTPDSRTLILGFSSGRVQLIDLIGGADSGAILSHHGEVRALACSPDGRFLASGGADTTAVVWDLPALLKRVPRRAPPAKVTPDLLDLWWASLGSNDPARASEALAMLGHFQKEALALFKERLRGVTAVDRNRIRQWIKDLDHDRFVVRDRALKGLIAAGDEAHADIEAALKQNPSEEVKRRLQQLLDAMGNGLPARKLVPMRAIELLDGIDDPQATQLLRDLATQTTDEEVKQEIDWVLSRKK